jgi:hypothetical protein
MRGGGGLSADQVRAYLHTPEGQIVMSEEMAKAAVITPPAIDSAKADVRQERCRIGMVGESVSTFILQYERNIFNAMPNDGIGDDGVVIMDGLQRPESLVVRIQNRRHDLALGRPLNDNVYIVSYNISDPISFNAAKEMIENIQKRDPDVFCVLLGQNLGDTAHYGITEREVRSFARAKGIQHYECDTREVESVRSVMHRIMQDYRFARQNAAINRAMPDRVASNCSFDRGGDGRYHYFRKQDVTDAFNAIGDAKASARTPYKIRLALDILGADAKSEDAICSLLLNDAFKDEYVYGVKFCPSNGVREGSKQIKVNEREKSSKTVKEVPLGKEADLYFTQPRFLDESKRDELEVLAKHVQLLRHLDRRVRELKLPLTTARPTEDNAKKLGLTSGVITITHDHGEKDERKEAEHRGGSVEKPEESIYTAVNEAAAFELLTIAKEIQDTKWQTGVFGGEKLFKNKPKVPAGVKAIYDELTKKNDDRTDIERLAAVKRLVTASHKKTGHGCLNQRSQVTTDFYDTWHTRLNRLVSRVQQKIDHGVPSVTPGLSKHR